MLVIETVFSSQDKTLSYVFNIVISDIEYNIPYIYVQINLISFCPYKVFYFPYYLSYRLYKISSILYNL